MISRKKKNWSNLNKNIYIPGHGVEVSVLYFDARLAKRSFWSSRCSSSTQQCRLGHGILHQQHLHAAQQPMCLTAQKQQQWCWLHQLGPLAVLLRLCLLLLLALLFGAKGSPWQSSARFPSVHVHSRELSLSLTVLKQGSAFKKVDYIGVFVTIFQKKC